MPSRLKRLHASGQSHFITFCSWHRRKLPSDPVSKNTLEAGIERVRLDFQFRIYGYVVVPDHVHLLLSEPHRATLADVLKPLKQGAP